MYSVIILTKETMENFSTYRSVFSEAIHRERVGFCIWNKAGQGIDDALPEIREMTDKKKEWNAVVLCSEPDQAYKRMSYVQNPYDIFGDDPEDETEESSDPLIRLTHMLGGVPQIERHFKSTIIHEPYKGSRMIYVPIEDDQRDRKFEELKSKYEYDGVPPTSITLISTRGPWKGEEHIFHSCQSHAESKSSEFWKRNRYPSSCRFLVFDFEKKGPIQKEADLFRFWMTVLTFATNKIDSSTLQAYRLYNIDTLFDKEKMEAAFQIAVNRLGSSRTAIKNDLNKELHGYSNQKSKIPSFSLSIPVDFELPKNSKCTVKSDSFHLLSNNVISDIGTWNTERLRAEESLIKSIRIADRALDQTAGRMKDSYLFNESEVVRLDKYQMEDLELETDLLYREIVDLQGNLPSGNLSNNAEIEKRSNSVKEYMRRRITTAPAIYTFIIGVVMIIAAQIPALLQFFMGEPISWALIGFEVVVFIGVMLLCGFATLFVQKKRLDGLIGDYNRTMQGVLNRLQSNAGEYSKYLGAIASHSRGRSYMSIANMKNRNAIALRALKYKHLSAMDLFLARLKAWGEAYHLDVDFDSPEIDDSISVDVAVPPVDNPMYSLAGGIEYEVEINKSGITIQTPFDFIHKLILVREEIYDDDSI